MILPLIKLSSDASYGPDEDKPDVLISCGTHSREWLTSESCVAFIDHMVKKAVTNPEVTELLDNLEIWVVPFVNPGGRFYDDDRYAFPPFTYTNTHGNPDIHKSWRKNRQWFDDFDCASDWGTRQFSGKCDTATLNSHYGIDIARNFSVGWDEYPPATIGIECMDTAAIPAAIPCGDHQGCDDLDGTDPATSTDMCKTNTNLFCNVIGHCAYSRRQSCCEIVFEGTRPFESIEARIIRHIMLNIPIVTLLEAHSYHGILGRVRKYGPNPDAHPAVTNHQIHIDDNDPSTPPPAPSWKTDYGLDRLNMDHVQREAIDAYNYASEFIWNFWHDPWDQADIPDFMLLSGQIYKTGEGVGQLPGWATGQAEVVAKDPDFYDYNNFMDNFDNNTFRGINAYEVELPPRTGFDPHHDDWPLVPDSLYQEGIDFNPHIECAPGAFSSGINECFYPDSQLVAKTVTAGFIALAKYIARDAMHPNVGRYRSGAHFSDPLYVSYSGSKELGFSYWDYTYGTIPGPIQRADTAVTSLLVHDGEGRGVLQGEFGHTEIKYEKRARIFLPAGNWAVSSDVVYENFDPGGTPWPTSYDLTISVVPFAQTFPLNPNCVSSQHTFQSGTIYPGDAGDTTYTRRFEFLPGCKYLIKSELTWALDNDTPVNDIRTLKVYTTACDSPDRPSHLTPHNYCNRRIHEDSSWDSNEFTCVTSSGICKQCFVDNSVFVDCDGFGICVHGMCDEPWECWSGSIEDGFEDELYIIAGGSERHFSDGNDFSFSGTLHKNAGEQDKDRTSWSVDDGGPSPMHFYNKVEVLVADRCDGPLSMGFPFDDVEIRILLHSGTWVNTWEVELSPWTTPLCGVRTTVLLAPDQRQAVENGAYVIVELRNVEDPTDPGTYPSLTYTANVSVGTGIEPIAVSDSGYQFLLQGHSYYLDPNLLANDDEMYRFAIPDDALTASDTIYFRPKVPYANPSEAPDMLVVDGLGDVVVTGVLDDMGGVAAELIRLIPDNGPFSVVLSSGDLDLKGDLYRCPISAQGDCFAFDVENYCDGTMCQTGEICCEVDPNQGIGCVDALNDVSNCGGCGSECLANEICLEGVCAVMTGSGCAGTTCPTGLTCCEDSNGAPSCVAVENDDDHCGWCNHDCPYWAKCNGGWCLPKTGRECQASCTGDTTCCYALGWERCVDTSQNPFNCGGCGIICDWGATCSDGECVPWLSVHDPCLLFGKVNCSAPYELDCSNLGTDEENCGSCGLMCAHGSTCVNGVCTRPWWGEQGETDHR